MTRHLLVFRPRRFSYAIDAVEKNALKSLVACKDLSKRKVYIIFVTFTSNTQTTPVIFVEYYFLAKNLFSVDFSWLKYFLFRFCVIRLNEPCLYLSERSRQYESALCTCNEPLMNTLSGTENVVVGNIRIIYIEVIFYEHVNASTSYHKEEHLLRRRLWSTCWDRNNNVLFTLFQVAH